MFRRRGVPQDLIATWPGDDSSRPTGGDVAESHLQSPDSWILVLDLDRFKAVNDDGGHDVGDALLCSLGPLLSRLLRKGDTRARAADVLYAQPIVALRTGQPERQRLEILLRLPDGHGGLQVAADFLPQAVRHHLMPAIDRWVVRETIARLGQWHRGHPDTESPVCSINLSASALTGNTLLPVIEAQLARWAIPGHSLCFEIEESDALGNLARTARFIEGIQATGCMVALDNYGSGISSFGFLRSLRVDAVKIGAPLVHGVAGDALSASIVSAIHRIGESLGIDTVATQVGSVAVLRQLEVLGLGYAQGVALAEPVPFTDVEGLLARFQQRVG